jgi:hypothetical protein
MTEKNIISRDKKSKAILLCRNLVIASEAKQSKTIKARLPRPKKQASQ